MVLLKVFDHSMIPCSLLVEPKGPCIRDLCVHGPTARPPPHTTITTTPLRRRQGVLKVLYLWTDRQAPEPPNPAGKINGWKHILDVRTIHYGDRVEAAN